MTIAASTNRRLPRTASLPRGRMITQKPLQEETGTDNVYYKNAPQQAPQAYVPYAPQNPVRPYGARPHYVPADNSMMTLALVGLIVTTFVGIPLGLFTGPSALKRADRVQELIRNGRRPQTDSSTITSVRILSWISIVWSIPLLLVWVALFGLIFLSLAH
ncbi:MAG: hypothetical protein KDB90_02175 [Planctomycetes bacterium]|nr:hypothetical protein [Planctomycetota bacterium]